jgi:hypothetical protein
MAARPLPGRTSDPTRSAPAAPDPAAVRAAVARAVPSFLATTDITDAATLALASNIGATYDLPDLAALREKAAATFGNETAPAAPMFRRMLFPDTPIRAEDVAQLQAEDAATRTQWLVATALTCGGPAFPPSWAQRVEEIINKPDETKGYVVTHAGVALKALSERGCKLDEAPKLRDDIIAKLQATVLAGPFTATDLQLEAAVVLQLLGRGDLIRPEWVTATLAAQLPDGSWDLTAGTKQAHANPHATLMATWFLGGVLNPQATGPFFS